MAAQGAGPCAALEGDKEARALMALLGCVALLMMLCCPCPGCHYSLPCEWFIVAVGQLGGKANVLAVSVVADFFIQVLMVAVVAAQKRDKVGGDV